MRVSVVIVVPCALRGFPRSGLIVTVSGCSVVEDGAGAGAEVAFWGWGALASGAVGAITDRLMDHLYILYRPLGLTIKRYRDEVYVIQF
jgi:hypothetical protein